MFAKLTNPKFLAAAGAAVAAGAAIFYVAVTVLSDAGETIEDAVDDLVETVSE